MAVENLVGDERTSGAGQAVSYGHAGALKMFAAKHFTVSAGASANSTYSVGVVSLSDRPSMLSMLANADLASTGAPTLDVGLFTVGSATNFTDDDDALNSGIDAATSRRNPGNCLIASSEANGGKQFWEFISGLTENPGGFAEVKITLKDAAANTGGSMYCELLGAHS